jgi:YgiT-type zinc finger domain-containing protein
MKCLICNEAEIIPGTTSILLERGSITLTITNVPARICPHCGEAYADEAVTASLLHQAGRTAMAGGKVDVQDYGWEPVL